MEGNAGIALILSLAAGLSTVIGGMAAVIMKHPGKRFLALTLGFSAGIMMTVSLADLIPEAAKTLVAVCGKGAGSIAVAACTIGGMLAACLIDTFVPEPGASDRDGMLRLGFFSMLALLIHNLPEGIAVFMSGATDVKLGASLAVAIALHNIPEGISVALPICYATGSRMKGIGMSFLSGMAEPFGAIVAYLFLRPFLGEMALAYLYAVIAGLMLFVVFDELLPASNKGRRPVCSLLGVLSGISVMLLSLYLI